MPTPPKDLRDILTMRNGDSLNAKVLNKTFTIDTDFGKLTAKTSDIVHITMEKGLPHQMIVTAGNILTGTIRDKYVSAIIFTGEVRKFRLPKDVLAIQFLDNVHPALLNMARGPRSGRRRR